MSKDLQNYMPFHSLHYPYFCFDRSGSLYVSAGQSSRRPGSTPITGK